MKLLIAIFMLFGISTSHAGQCYSAYKDAKKLESIVEGIYYILGSLLKK